MVRRQTFYEDIHAYLTTGNFWPGASENEKKNFKEKAIHFDVYDGQLYRVEPDKEKRLVVTEPNKRLEVIQACHVDPSTNCHLGREKTKKNVTREYYWQGMYIDIMDYIKQCPGCFTGESRASGRPPYRSGIGKRGQLWKMVEVEIFGPFSNESSYCLVNVVDLISKWISCIPVKSSNPKEIAKCLVSKFSIMGIPTAVRFIKIESSLAGELINEFEKEFEIFMSTVENVSYLLSQDTSGDEGQQLACPKVIVNQLMEDDDFYIKDLDSLEVFVSGKQTSKETGYVLYLYIFVGLESLLNVQIRDWYSETLDKFMKLYPDTWPERLPYYSFCLRSCLPPMSVRTPNYLMFFREMDIFKFTTDHARSEELEEEDLSEFVMMDSKKNKASLSFYRYPEDNLSVEFEEEEIDDELEEEEDETEEEDEDEDEEDYDGGFDGSSVYGEESELSNADYSDSTSNRGIKKSMSEEEGTEDNVPPKKRRKPYIVDLKRSKARFRMRKRNSYVLNKDRLNCDICKNVFFLNHMDLEKHNSFHIDDTQNFKCPLCDKTSQVWGSIYLHYVNNHENDPNNLTMEAGGDEVSRCPYCAKEFTFKDRMLRHLRVIHLGKKAYHCDICKEEFKQKKFFQKHMATHEDRVYNCEDCNFTTKMYRNYKIHRRIHEGPGLACPVCQEMFPVRSSLTQHMASHGGGGQRVLCEHCGVSLKSRGSLMAHVKRMHRETQWLLCSHCGFKAKTTSNLNAHIDRIHKKNYHCSMCVFATKEESSFRRHMDIFHNDQRKFPCQQCDYRGANAKSLSEHMRVQHNPSIQRFTCNYCNATFKTLSMLRDHIPGHTGVAIYFCRLCDYRCKYRSNAHRHAKAKHQGLQVKDCITRVNNGESQTGIGPSKRKERLGKLRPSYVEGLDPIASGTMQLGNDVVVSTDPYTATMITHPIITTGANTSVLTVDPTGTLLFDSSTGLPMNNNVAVQVVQDDNPNLTDDEQTGRAVELLLLAMGQNRH